MKKVFVGMPIHRHWYHESQRLFEENVYQAKGWKLGALFRLYEESLIQRARHNILKEFLKSDCDFLFFLDDDILMMTPDTINQLVETKGDIIGGLYICKKPPYNPVYMPFEPSYHDFGASKSPVSVRYVSTGCMLISRKAAEAVNLCHPYPFECFETSILKGETSEQIYLSEDWAFCHRANELGLKCVLNPSPVLGHLGQYAFSINDYYSMIAQEKSNG